MIGLAKDRLTSCFNGTAGLARTAGATADTFVGATLLVEADQFANSIRASERAGCDGRGITSTQVAG